MSAQDDASRGHHVDARGALIGALVMAGFAIAWVAWGGGALSGSAATAVTVGGLVVGVLLIVAAVRQLRRSPPGSGTSMVGSRRYWTLVGAEAIAIAAGAAILGRSDHARYIAAWVAAVVGAHFVAFGRMFWGGFFVVGAVMLAGAAAALALGLAGAGDDVVIPVAALVVAADLFAASGLAIGTAARATAAVRK